MRKALTLSLFLSLICLENLSAQSSSPFEYSFTEGTSDAIKFRMYLDTIDKYMYVDYQVVLESMKGCEKLLDKGVVISKKDELDYVLARVDYEQGQNNTLKSYQLMRDHEYLLELKEIPIESKNYFIYARGFTCMVLGDLEFAQKTYYDLLEYGRNNQDTSSIIQSLFSLGQLFEGEEDYENAEKYFLEVYDFKEKNDLRGNSHPLLFLELTFLYIGMKEFDKASDYAEKGLQYLKEFDVKDFKDAFLLLKGEIALERKDIKMAEAVYAKVLKFNEETGIVYSANWNKRFYADLLNAKGLHKEALNVYEELIADDSKEIIFETEDFYKKAHEISNKMGDHQKAYDYILKANVIRDSIQKEKKMQQTQYLKIKFDAESKEKENGALVTQVLQEQFHNKFLYALASIFLLSILILIGAFFQKRNYNRRLKEEVKKRTLELEKTNDKLVAMNQELDGFNRILSHDLKEPLRSIVGFSTLAKKEVTEDSKLGKYMNYVVNSGKQLHQLINDVSIFQSIGNNISDTLEMVNTGIIVKEIKDSIKLFVDNKHAVVKCHDLPSIYTSRPFLFLVFKNLIENGIKYNESELPVIEIRYYQKEKTHFFQFEDNGIGIAPKFQEKVFGMFKRLNTRSEYEGSGLGLNIAKKMVKKMNGDISILYSDEGEGSVFQVSFPVFAASINPVDEALAEQNN